ncbi:MAG: efflux RND transporter periplasmic adaptor subunit [Sphingobacteriaceae bacterium]
MGKTTKYILIALAVVVVALAIAKYMGLIGGSSKTQVVTEKVMNRTIVETVSASGKIQPEIEVKLSSEVSGEIVELPIKEGDVVKKGQLLCKIRPDILTSGYNRAVASFNAQKASVGSSAEQLNQSAAAFRNQEASFKRNKELFEKKVLSAAEFDAARADYETGKASLEAARQNVIGARFGLEQTAAAVKEASDNLAKTTIYAPNDGVISMLSVEKGERVVGTAQMAGTEIMRIADLNTMEVSVDVNENDINRVAKGDTAKIEVDAFLDKKFDGVVTQIGSSANVVGTSADQVTNFKVKVRILPQSYQELLRKNNANQSPFRPGLSATVDIQTNRKTGLSIPIQAVTARVEEKTEDASAPQKNDDNKPKITPKAKEFVFVFEDGKVKQVEVQSGIQDDNHILIISGLKSGQEVVSAPYAAISKTLKDSMEVEKVDKSKLFNTDAKAKSN